MNQSCWNGIQALCEGHPTATEPSPVYGVYGMLIGLMEYWRKCGACRREISLALGEGIRAVKAKLKKAIMLMSNAEDCMCFQLVFATLGFDIHLRH